MAYPDLVDAPRRRGTLVPALVLLLAFALGIGVTIAAARRYSGLAAWLGVRPAAVTVVQPAPRPAPRIVAAPSDPALDERVSTIESRIDEIDERASEASGDADRAEGLLVAFAARRALDRGQPLGYIEGMLRERFGGTDALAVAQIIAASQRPITLAQLQDGLATARAELEARGPDRGWWQGVRQEMGSLFIVRRADQPSAIPADRMARAVHALDDGQADAAAAEVARMPGATQPQAQAWLAQARRYVLARAALDRIETDALLAPRRKPAPASQL